MAKRPPTKQDKAARPKPTATVEPDRWPAWSIEPRRIGELADHLDLEEFGVLGCSSGGPNASSCARHLGSRVLACAIVSGPAPPEGRVSTQGTMRVNRVAKRLEVLAPRLMSPLFQAGLRQGRRSPEKSLTWMLRHVPDNFASTARAQ